MLSIMYPLCVNIYNGYTYQQNCKCDLVRCFQPSSSSLLYARQQSVMTVDSLLTWRSIMSISVAASLLFSGHTAKNTSFVSWQIPPTIHWPSTKRPVLYLRLPNLLSSISTVNPAPPISCGPCLLVWLLFPMILRDNKWASLKLSLYLQHFVNLHLISNLIICANIGTVQVYQN